MADRLKKSAKKQGRSLLAEVKRILEQAADESRNDADNARKLISDIRRRFKGRDFPYSTKLIREDRDR